MSSFKDLTNQTFGRLKVIERFGYDKNKRITWLCECQCEQKNLVVVLGKDLVAGNRKSCGCLNKTRIRHGESKTKLYEIWKSMKKRIRNKNCDFYKDYGGRGIEICDEWFVYENFRNWAFENGYKEGLSIERKDVNGDYCPENCCWITKEEQADNKRNTIWIDYNGEKLTLKQWSEKLGISKVVLKNRIFVMGWDIERALFTPVRPKKSNK